MWLRSIGFLFFVLCNCAFGQVQSVSPFQNKILPSFSAGGKLPISITLAGSAEWTAGSLHDSGTVQLRVAADGTTNESWSFSEVSHTIQQGPVEFLNLDRRCTYTSKDDKERTVSGPNCLRGVPWFFPSFSLSPSYAGATSVTDESDSTDTALGLVKLRYAPSFPGSASLNQAGRDALSRLAQASAVTVSYDARTSLPTLLVYQEALDNDESRSTEISVQFSDYRLESGFMIPHRIRRYVQRTLQVDLNVTNVVAQ